MVKKVVCTCMALGMSVLMLSCGGGYDNSTESTGRCDTNLALLAKAIVFYVESKDFVPPNISMLFPNPITDKTLYRCPSSSDDPTKFEEGMILKPNQCSYIYNNLGNFSGVDEDTKARLILLYEKKDYHGPGRNVAYANAKTAYLPTAEFNEALAFTEKWMKENAQ